MSDDMAGRKTQPKKMMHPNNLFAPTLALTHLSDVVAIAGDMETGPDMMTAADVAKQLGVTPKTVRRLCDTGQLHHARVGNRGRGGVGEIRISRADLAEFIERQRETKPEPTPEPTPEPEPAAEIERPPQRKRQPMSAQTKWGPTSGWKMGRPK